MTQTGLTALSVRCLNGARSWGHKLLCLRNGSQPKAVEVVKVVAGSLWALALDDGVSPKIL